ncbi:MAG: DUF2974 domain-containing protein [bacterium]|nr:DUF2974 domain-containing protein [bacterium]
MSNMLDYIRWRGDLPFSVIPLGEVDGLILAQLSMIFWEKGMGRDESRPLSELAQVLKGKTVSAGFTAKNDALLLETAAASARFGGLVLSDFEHDFDEGAQIQFAAVTFHLPDGDSFLSFRGTDSTLVGWKEDLSMSYEMPIPAQAAAAAYFARVAARTGRRLYAGGHSKGGNLAMYAAAQTGPDILKRIIRVYNYDGPGFPDRGEAARLYETIRDRLMSFVPQSSIIGMLLAHPDGYEIVESDSVSILQHDPYSWQVEGCRFVRSPMLTKDSLYIQSVIRRWLAEVDDEERRLFVDTLFHVLGSTDARSFDREFWMGFLTHPGTVLASLQDIDPDSRRRIGKMLADLGRAALLEHGEQLMQALGIPVYTTPRDT